MARISNFVLNSGAFSLLAPTEALTQDMMGLDVTSDAFTKSEMTRADIEKSISTLLPGAILEKDRRDKHAAIRGDECSSCKVEASLS
jgi:hypothetical protein